MTPISICVIMKTEEKNIDTFLSSIRHFFKNYPHEIVLADTGSEDNSLSIARKYTDEVERFFNRKTFHYEAIIHEQVRAIDGCNFMRIALPLVVDHCGYNGNPEKLRKKAERNNELLFKMLEF